MPEVGLPEGCLGQFEISNLKFEIVCIFVVRGMKVMLDMTFAVLYQVEKRTLKQAVRHNITRFPTDFMIEMTAEELENWRSQIVTSSCDTILTIRIYFELRASNFEFPLIAVSGGV